jgi:hypothetical protein
MAKIALAPCPYCGGTDAHFSWTRNPRSWIVGGPRLRAPESVVTHYVVCRLCGAGTDPRKTRREAATCWNERTGWSVLLWCRSCETCTNPCKTREEAAAWERSGCYRWPAAPRLALGHEGIQGRTQWPRRLSR